MAAFIPPTPELQPIQFNFSSPIWTGGFSVTTIPNAIVNIPTIESNKIAGSYLKFLSEACFHNFAESLKYR